MLKFFQLLDIMAVLISMDKFIFNLLNLLNLRLEGYGKIRPMVFLDKVLKLDLKIPWFVVSEVWSNHKMCI